VVGRGHATASLGYADIVLFLIDICVSFGWLCQHVKQRLGCAGWTVVSLPQLKERAENWSVASKLASKAGFAGTSCRAADGKG